MPVRGARETAGALRALAEYVSTPLNAASRFALQPTLSTARRNVGALPLDEETGTLQKSLTIKRNPRSSKLNPVHQVGPSSDVVVQTIYGKRRPVKYAHILEFGAAPHQIGEEMHPGVSPRPFLTPAFLATREQVVKRFGDRIGPEMEKRAAKLRAKGR